MLRFHTKDSLLELNIGWIVMNDGNNTTETAYIAKCKWHLKTKIITWPFEFSNSCMQAVSSFSALLVIRLWSYYCGICVPWFGLSLLTFGRDLTIMIDVRMSNFIPQPFYFCFDCNQIFMKYGKLVFLTLMVWLQEVHFYLEKEVKNVLWHILSNIKNLRSQGFVAHLVYQTGAIW